MSKKTNEATPFSAKASRADLLRCVGRAAAVVERRNTIPILSYVKLSAKNGRITVEGNNLDQVAIAHVEADGAGATCLPAMTLRDMLRALPGEDVSFQNDADGMVAIRSGSSTAKFGSLPPTDFPDMTVGSVLWSYVLPEGVFGFLVGGAAVAMSSEETRYYLNGVCIEAMGGALVATATDGHRLSTRSTNLVKRPADRSGIIIPRDAIPASLSQVGGGECRITAYGSIDKAGKEHPTHLDIATTTGTLRTKLIDGTFPDWRRVIPKESRAVLSVEVKALRQGLRMARAVAGERGRTVKFSPCEGGISLDIYNPSVGTINTRLDTQGNVAFDPLGLNCQYLDDITGAIERVGSRHLHMHITSSSDAVKIVPDAEIVGAMAILMPVRI